MLVRERRAERGGLLGSIRGRRVERRELALESRVVPRRAACHATSA
jgi:hypothetical protein